MLALYSSFAGLMVLLYIFGIFSVCPRYPFGTLPLILATKITYPQVKTLRKAEKNAESDCFLLFFVIKEMKVEKNS